MPRLLLILLAIRTLAAQPMSIADQEAARARILLASPNWTEKAWGAYFAGRLHSDDLRTPLLDQLRAAAHQADPHYVSVLLDAAIESQLAAPAADIEPFLDNWNAAAVILLALSPDAEQTLLRLADVRSFSFAWLAANNLLCEKKSRPWYRKLVTDLNITHRFTVTDPGIAAGTGGMGGGVCGDSLGAPMPKGFPPIARYALEQRPARGSVLLAAGPHNVYYNRTIVPADKPTGFGSCSEMLDPATVREEYLAPLSGLSEQATKSRVHGDTHITFTGRDAFQRTVEQSLIRQEAQLRELFQAIDQRTFRTPPGMRLQIVIDVVDLRENKLDPLPSLSPREITL